MDEFKPEDELKPDASDRRPSRPRKSSSAPKVPVSRQHMMMGIGILVLLLLVLGIGSALKGPDKPAPANNASTAGTPAPAAGNAASSGGEKNIDLSGSSSMSGQNGNAPAPQGEAADGTTAAQNAPTAGNGPQEISAPPISPTPTEGKSQPVPQGQQRVELPGDLNSALSNQQNQVNNVADGAQDQGGSLPTAPATVAPGAARAPAAKTPAATNHAAAAKPAASNGKHATASHTTQAQTAKSSGHESKPASSTVAKSAASASGAMPHGNYTLQLSGASRAESLNAWAKKQNLNGYHVYKTTRNGQPWYVLVAGSYATPADAKRAVASMPAEVRAQNPWVKPVSQVKKEAN